jgi:hypothetical protein
MLKGLYVLLADFTSSLFAYLVVKAPHLYCF